MFKNLLSYETKRTALQALGFYLFYVLIAILSIFIVGVLIGIALSLANPEYAKLHGYKVGNMMGVVLAIISSPLLAFTIIRKKGQSKVTLNVVLTIISALVALLGGVILGFIPAAYFTTLDNKK